VRARYVDAEDGVALEVRARFDDAGAHLGAGKRLGRGIRDVNLNRAAGFAGKRQRSREEQKEHRRHLVSLSQDPPGRPILRQDEKAKIQD